MSRYDRPPIPGGARCGHCGTWNAHHPTCALTTDRCERCGGPSFVEAGPPGATFTAPCRCGSVHGSVHGSVSEGPRIGDGSVTDRSHGSVTDRCGSVHGSVDGSVTDRSSSPDGSVGRIGERDGSDRMAERHAKVCRGWTFDGPVVPQLFPLFLIVKRAGEPDRRMLVVGWRPALVHWAPAGAEDVWLPVAVTPEGGAMGPKQLGPPAPGESWDFAS